MNKILTSVGILTFNSADTLRRALLSVRDFDDIIICDGGSTDATLAIAQEFGARCISQDKKFKNPNNTLADYSGVRNQLLAAAKHDWFLYIDSDETISDGLREEIRIVIEHPDGSLVYRVPIGILMDGRYIKHSTNYPGYQHRFFNKRSGAWFKRPVHERIAFNDGVKIGTFKHPWYIHTTREYWNHYLEETSSYRPLEVLKSCDTPFVSYLIHTVFWHVRVAAGVACKGLYMYIRYGFKDSIPVRGELGRMAAPLLLIWQVTVCRARKLLLHK